jgi:hypothetical protein
MYVICCLITPCILRPASSQIAPPDFVSLLPKIALSELKTLTLVYNLYFYLWISEIRRECRICELREFFHFLRSISLQQSSILQVIDMHLKINMVLRGSYDDFNGYRNIVMHIDTESELGLLVDSALPAIFPLVMEQIKALKISVNCKYSITIVNQQHKNAPLFGAEKRLEIEKQLKEAHPSLTDECLTVEWRDDVHCLGDPFRHIII